MNYLPLPEERWIVQLLLGDDNSENGNRMDIDTPQNKQDKDGAQKGNEANVTPDVPKSNSLASEPTVRTGAARLLLQLANIPEADCIFTVLVAHLHDAFFTRPFCPTVRYTSKVICNVILPSPFVVGVLGGYVWHGIRV